MLNNSIDKNIDNILKKYNYSKDIAIRKMKIKSKNVALIFNQSITKSEDINNFILKNINNKKYSVFNNKFFEDLKNNFSGPEQKVLNNIDEICKYISNSYTIILFNKYALAVQTKDTLSRGINSPDIEQTISGPKDSFNENYLTNIGLIRKRIKSPELTLEEKTIGNETKTKVGIFYMNNIIEKKLLNEIKDKLDKIDIDSILDSTYIRELICDKSKVFPLIETTERPDLASMSLIEGKICLVVENSPTVLIIPTFFVDLFKAPEDYYQKPVNVSFTRIIRLIAFFIAVLLPGFYIAITTFNHETIPVTLIVNFAAQRDGVPFPAAIEAIGMALIFEILRESDIRMPSTSGSAISILGAIVLGDAAVSAGVVSPIMLMVIAISAICSLMFSHIAMVNAIRVWKLIFIILASLLGLTGIYIGIFLFLTILSSMKSFGKPYLYPIAPLNEELVPDTYIKTSIKKKKKNPLLWRP